MSLKNSSTNITLLRGIVAIVGLVTVAVWASGRLHCLFGFSKVGLEDGC